MLSNNFNINLPSGTNIRIKELSVNLVDPTQLGVGSYPSVN